MNFLKNVVPSLFANATRRLRLEVKFHLIELKKMPSPHFFAKAMCRLRLEVKFHLSEFEKRRPFTFLRRQRADFA